MLFHKLNIIGKHDRGQSSLLHKKILNDRIIKLFMLENLILI